MGDEGSDQIHPLPDGQGQSDGWLREIGGVDREEYRWCGEGYEDGDHSGDQRLRRGRSGAPGLQNVDYPGPEGGRETEERDLFLSRIRDPHEEEEEDCPQGLSLR